MNRPPPLQPPAPPSLSRLPRRIPRSVRAMAARPWSLVWETSRSCSRCGWPSLTMLAGALPALVALIWREDRRCRGRGQRQRRRPASRCSNWWRWKARAVAVLALTSRGLSLRTTLLREQLGFRVNSMILDKALTLDLEHFEDSEFYDRLHARAARSLAAAAEPGDAQFLAGAEPRVAGELRRAAVHASRPGPWCCWCSPACPDSSPKRSFPTMPSGCSAGVPPSGACRPISRP